MKIQLPAGCPVREIEIRFQYEKRQFLKTGYITRCFLNYLGCESVYEARCNPQDQFQKRIGRKVSLTKALESLLEYPEIDSYCAQGIWVETHKAQRALKKYIWEQYLSKTRSTGKRNKPDKELLATLIQEESDALLLGGLNYDDVQTPETTNGFSTELIQGYVLGLRFATKQVQKDNKGESYV